MSTATRATGCRCAGALSRARLGRLTAAPFLAVLGPAGGGVPAPWLVSVTLPSYQTASSTRPGRTAGYGEAIVTGQQAGASGPGERRCIGEVPPQGAQRTWGGRGVIPPGKPP